MCFFVSSSGSKSTVQSVCHQSNLFVKIVQLRRLCSDKDTFYNSYLFYSSRANRTVQAFMDIVGGPFNHLVPSDQLDDSLLLGQNLECEASDEFETGHGHPEDSLKNMLSDKDPMFGSASAQFHLLENEDVNFKLGSSAGTVVAFEVCLWFNLEKSLQLTPSTVCFADADHDMTAAGVSQSQSDGENSQSSFSRGRRHAGLLQRRQTGARNIRGKRDITG